MADITEQDVNDDAMSVFTEDTQSPPAEDSSPKEQKTEVVEPEATEDTVTDDTAQESEEAESPEAETGADSEVASEPSDETQAEEQPQGEFPKAEERKQALNAEIRDLVAQRNEIRAEVERANSEAYAPASVEDLIAQGYSENDARLKALEDKVEMENYNTRVADAQLSLESESNRVLRDYPIFDPSSDQFNKELAAEAANLLNASLIHDPNTGQIIGSNVSPYSLYKTLATAAQVSATQGQVKGQRAAEKMMARADTVPSASQAKTKAKDPTDPMTVWEDD